MTYLCMGARLKRPLYQLTDCIPPFLLINAYDRTCKESLYNTYPYLTYSNEKSTSPVMKKCSMLGYREKIDTEAYC